MINQIDHNGHDPHSFTLTTWYLPDGSLDPSPRLYRRRWRWAFVGPAEPNLPEQPAAERFVYNLVTDFLGSHDPQPVCYAPHFRELNGNRIWGFID